ncbi:unnamed protein product [Penicillium salamii]|uniref:Uncharacterized protein n=1 Tax=Penicillium salamii TaxID=1612424 RepID=A0A9W4I6E9_9EURO|nr:unnamed protein product [Penicillium salamii]CAG8381900.1 unnamed protein product [Penicillium salamii]CAG8418781.1 unnamed protein product [Penicillium salamii]CAG8586782.1 unnamed protein product [Penicillium salamii]
MSDVERRLAILMQALVKTGLEYICPRCFRLFSDPNACYRHCRKEGEGGEGEGNEGDDIHRGLGLITKKDFPEFLQCYRVAIGFPINEGDLPLEDDPGRPGRRYYNKCFSVEFVLDNCLPGREVTDAMLLAVIKI